VRVGDFAQTRTVLSWVKDGLMAIFFLVVGMEIKFEVLRGELSSPRRLALPIVAADLNISKAEVHGAISFYHDFRTAPAGEHVLKICRAEACQSMGAERLVARARERHGLKMGETTADGRLTLEAVYCLGNCALSPAAMLDGELIGRFDAARLDAIVEDRAA